MAAALIAVGLVFATTGTLQGATGRYVGLRRLTVASSVDKIRLGGWVGAGLGFVAILLATSMLTAGVLRTAFAVSMWIVLFGGCAVLLLRLRDLQLGSDPHPPTLTRPWTLAGACGAVAALTLFVAATIDIAVAGRWCSWPQSATTLSGLGLVVSVVPALVAIRQTLRHERRPIAYWVMVVADVGAIGVYVWLLAGHDHACTADLLPNILK